MPTANTREEAMTHLDEVDCSSILYAWFHCRANGQTGKEVVWIEFACEVLALEGMQR